MGLFGKKNTRIDAKSFAIKVDEVFQSVGKSIFDASDIQKMVKQSELFRSKLTALYMVALEKKDYTKMEIEEFATVYLRKNGIEFDDEFKENYYEAVNKQLNDGSFDSILAVVKSTMGELNMPEDMIKKTADKVVKNLG